MNTVSVIVAIHGILLWNAIVQYMKSSNMEDGL